MTEAEFNNYKLAVAWRYVKKAEFLADKIRIGIPYSYLKKDIKEFLLTHFYIKILLEYTLPDDVESSTNFFTPTQMKNLALKINYLTGLRYNYNFIKDN